MGHVHLDESGTPIEIDEGRGDLRYTSMPFELWDGGPFLGSRPVSFAKVFATQQWVAIAVMRLLTWSVRVPLKVYRRTDSEGGRKRVMPGEHPLADAITAPWERGSSADLVMGMLGPLLVHGNTPMGVEDGARGKLRFDPHDWRCVEPIRFDNEDPNSEIVGWKIARTEGSPTIKSADNVMHLRWWSPLGKLGVSPLYQLRNTLTAESAAIDWTLNSLKHGVRPNGVVEMSDEVLGLEQDQRRIVYERAVEDWKKYQGSENAGKVPILPPGMTWSDGKASTAVEAELIAQRQVNRNEVSSVYQLPPPTIGILERATFNNIIQLREMAYTDGLAPPLILCESTMNAHVVRDLLREDDLFVEFDFGLILRGDRLKEIKAIREGVNSALYTPDEGRQILNMPKSNQPGADLLYLPTNNLQPIGGPAGGGEEES